MTKSLFVAATRQNDGKTMVSLGLYNAIQKRFKKVAYMKPVGQQYRIVNGDKIDKDVVLMVNIYGISDHMTDMSPIAIPSGFTADYIEHGNREELVSRVKNGYRNLADNNEFVLIEGTGHAGVGSVFDMSNADVARMLGAKVIMVSRGGVGKPIDELMMNKALFDKKGVEILGVIVNKVDANKYDRIAETVTKGLARQGLKVFGVIPLIHMLSKPSILELVEDLGGELLCSDQRHLINTIGKFVIGDLLPSDALNVLNRKALLIVPGNREGLIMTALSGSVLDTDNDYSVAGMVFTEGIRPHPRVMELVERSGIPTMLVKEDSFSVATKINNAITKLRSEETEKVSTAKELVEQYVDIDHIVSLL